MGWGLCTRVVREVKNRFVKFEYVAMRGRAVTSNLPDATLVVKIVPVACYGLRVNNLIYVKGNIKEVSNVTEVESNNKE